MMHIVPTPGPGPVNARAPEGAETDADSFEPPEPLQVLPPSPGVVVGVRIAVVFGRRLEAVVLLVGARMVAVFGGRVETVLVCV